MILEVSLPNTIGTFIAVLLSRTFPRQFNEKKMRPKNKIRRLLAV